MSSRKINIEITGTELRQAANFYNGLPNKGQLKDVGIVVDDRGNRFVVVEDPSGRVTIGYLNPDNKKTEALPANFQSADRKTFQNTVAENTLRTILPNKTFQVAAGYQSSDNRMEKAVVLAMAQPEESKEKYIDQVLFRYKVNSHDADYSIDRLPNNLKTFVEQGCVEYLGKPFSDFIKDRRPLKEQRQEYENTVQNAARTQGKVP
jgi:hypothetical protein